MTNKESSYFESHTRQELLANITALYLKDALPWVVGFSGGKDSTLTLQVVWEALRTIPRDKRAKKVFVVASDTMVEAPRILDRINQSINQINERAIDEGLPIEASIVTPKLNDSFWVNLIGRGYPAPTVMFRWCTERMKIHPTSTFVTEKIDQHGEVIVVLGVRESESATRAQLMNSYLIKGTALRRHNSLPGAFVYAPIASFSTEDVWSYLLQVENPWGDDNKDLAALYKDASSGECPMVIDLSTSSCGSTRFGCWTCTVATKDQSMEALIDSGDDWLEPLLEYRNFLAETNDPEKKKVYRAIRGRQGREVLKKDGTLAARTFKLSVSKHLLERLLKTQKDLKDQGSTVQLITLKELELIRKIWRLERQDWEDSVPKMAHEILGLDHDWLLDDNVHFDNLHMQLLDGVCKEYAVPPALVAKLLQVEKDFLGINRRKGISKALDSVLREEWRDEEEILEEINATEKLGSK